MKSCGHPNHGAPDHDCAPFRQAHTREEHAAILESHRGERGVMFHRYRRCGFSGAGNCCCGRAHESALHPHPFTLSANAREHGRWMCVCSKGEDHPSHDLPEGNRRDNKS